VSNTRLVFISSGLNSATVLYFVFDCFDLFTNKNLCPKCGFDMHIPGYLFSRTRARFRKPFCIVY